MSVQSKHQKMRNTNSPQYDWFLFITASFFCFLIERTKEWATFGCAEKTQHRNRFKFLRRYLWDKMKPFYVVNWSAQFYKGRYKGFKIMHEDKPRQWSSVNVTDW